MTLGARHTPAFPICKLAEYTVTASSVRRRSLVRSQIRNALDESGKRRWWYQEARADIRKFIRNPSATRHDLVAAGNSLRDLAAIEPKESKRGSLLASARAVEAFVPIADSVRSKQVVASSGLRDDGGICRATVDIIVAPDVLFLERGSEAIVGALKLHASQEFKLNREALLNAASMLFTYLDEHGEKPVRAHCTVVDVFSPAYESAPVGIRRRMQTVEAACEEIAGWWNAMYERVQAEVEAKLKKQEG